VLLTDTVGFIQKLPTDLVAAFQATLEEIAEADLLLHVIDGSHENAESQRKTVMETLEEIGAGEIPILTVYNKVDLLDETSLQELKKSADPLSLFISAKEGLGFAELIEAIAAGVIQGFEKVTVFLPFNVGRLVSLFHEKGHVEKLEHEESGVRITGSLPVQLLSFFEEYVE
jgi:GTP-binding protein HflX